jgi:hypothetical protein
MIPVETITGTGGEGDEGKWLRRLIHAWYLWYIVRT